MPILAPETSVLPADLLQAETPADLPGKLHILHVKPNQSKAVARALAVQSVPFYLPLFRKRNVRGKRVTESYNPLLGNYMFLCDRDHGRVEADSDIGSEIRQAHMTNRVVHILPVADQEKLLGELKSLSKLIATDAPLQAEELIETGEFVRVKTGPFADHEGYVVTRHSKRFLIVAITSLRMGVTVKLDDCRIERLDRDPEGMFPADGTGNGESGSRSEQAGTIEIVRNDRSRS